VSVRVRSDNPLGRSPAAGSWFLRLPGTSARQGLGDANLIADAEKAGTVGCSEAFDVLAEYFKQTPARAQSTLRQLTVNGWDCSSVDATIGCGNAQGLRFHTELLK
jgi:hypothetical protein